MLLKDYLRELPDPLCTSSLYQLLMDALSVRVPDDDVGNAQLMFSILDCLPAVNQVNNIGPSLGVIPPRHWVCVTGRLSNSNSVSGCIGYFIYTTLFHQSGSNRQRIEKPN